MNDLVKTLILKPRVSEKAYGLSMTRNTYVFDVPSDTNKHLIKDAVEQQFNVTVIGVNVAISKGKPKRSYRKRKQPIAGKRINVKRAYVALKAGDSIPVFATADDKDKK